MLLGQQERQLEQTQEGLDKYESVIREFLKEYFENNCHGYGLDVDFSAPTREDMNRVRSGDYEITYFSVNGNDEIKNLDFYIGKTEVHLTGEAAKKIHESLSS